MCSLPSPTSLALPDSPLFSFTWNFFSLHLPSSVCQAWLRKKMFEKVTVSFHHQFLLFNFFAPSLCTCQCSFLSLACPSDSFPRSLRPSPSRPCSEKLRSLDTARAEGPPTRALVVLGVCCVAAAFSQVPAILVLTLTPFFSHSPSLIPRGCPSGI